MTANARRSGARCAVWTALAAAAALSLAGACQRQAAPARALRVCADPNNLPYSEPSGRRLREQDRGAARRRIGMPQLDYTWWAQRRGFVRNTLKAGTCDVTDRRPGRLRAWR